MNKILNKSVATVALFGISMFAASGAMAAVMNSIADSYHNLGSGNTKLVGPNNTATTPTTPNKMNAAGTAEVCVFCHTPHGGDAITANAPPIWNRQLNVQTFYDATRYSKNLSTTFDAAEGVVAGVSLACLSCHDGGQALDSVINQPGSGGWTDPAGVAYGNMPRIGGGMIGSDVLPNGRLSTTIVQNLFAGAANIGLRNDHPISMQYAGGGFVGAAGNVSGTSRDPDFTNTAAPSPTTNPRGQLRGTAAPTGSPLNTLFWIERFAASKANGTRDRADVILYTRTDTAIEPFVECGSCHDPHNVDNPTFLRVANSTLTAEFPRSNGGPSELCLTCHIK